MANFVVPTAQIHKGIAPANVQPGGGFCMRLELAWGVLRRACLRLFRPGYVRRMAELRQGDCPNCPHHIIDARDLKYYRNVCGYWFTPEDDRFRWRDELGLARAGLAEVFIFSLFFAALFFGLIWLRLIGLPGWLFTLLTVILLPAWAMVVFFFRDPDRDIPIDASAFVSPADGTITDISEVGEPDFGDGRALRIGIFLSILSVHINRCPRHARVTQVRYLPGRFLAAFKPEVARENAQMWVDYEDVDTGRPLRVKQIAGAIARRIVCWLKPGDTVRAGERFGMIKFGSRTELYVPAGQVDVAVQVGQKVKGGETILLRLKD